jgi:DNA-binding NtrC family response regulator
VDDEKPIVKLCVRALKQHGYTVSGFYSSTDAFQAFKADPYGFDLIISDMAMPNMVGSELSKRVLDIRPDMAIIICSGYSEKMDETKLKELNIRDFLDKPLLVQDLLAKVRRVLSAQKED